MKRYIYPATVFIIFSLLFLALPTYFESSQSLQNSSLKTRDLFFRIRRWSTSPSDVIKNIVIVSIDEESCDKLDARWPWPRKFFTQMLDGLSRAGAKVVALNVSFTGLENGDEASTGALAQAMHELGSVVIGDTFNRENQIVRPNPMIVKAVSRYGYLEKIVDPDFVIRRSYLLRPYENSSNFESSFPLQVAAEAVGLTPKSEPVFDRDLGVLSLKKRDPGISIGGDGSYFINYSALESDFAELPAWRLIQGQSNERFLQGKIVLVGLTSALFADRHATPLGGMSGVAIHANELLSILSGRNLHFLPIESAYLLAWVLGLTVLTFFLFYNFWVGGVVFALLLLGVFLGTEALFAKDYVLEPFLLFLGLFLGFFGGVVSNYIKLILANKGLETRIIIDKMTGLYNYDFLRARLEEEWKSSKKTKQSLSIVMTDLDRFKKINDTLGHEVGNDMIKRAGAVLKQTARGYDVVARYGGDEFFVLLWHTGHEEAKAYRERLRNAYHEMVRQLSEPALQDSSISIGIASFDPKIDPKRPESPQKLLEEADKDLFVDKESRRKPGDSRR